jgi:hypothetical protein
MRVQILELFPDWPIGESSVSGHSSVQAQVDKSQHEAELVKIQEMNSDDM